MAEKKRIKTGRPPKPEKNKSVKISLEARHVALLDKVIRGSAELRLNSKQLALRRRRLLGDLIERTAPRLFLTLGEFREDVQHQLGVLATRISEVESPTLDPMGEIWLLEDQLKTIEDNFMRRINNFERRLAALEAIKK